MATYSALVKGNKTFKDTTAANVFNVGADATKVTIAGKLTNGDIVNIEGLASEYTVKASGRTVTLKSDTQTIVFQLSNVSGEASVRFLDGDLTAKFDGKVSYLGAQKLSKKYADVNDATLGANDSSAAIDAATGGTSSGTTGSTFTLTDTVDAVNNFTGSAGSDTFVVTSAVDDAGDELDGGAGTDILKATLSASLAAIDARNIEIVQVRATAAATVDLDYVADATKVVNDRSSAALTIDNFDKVTTVEIDRASADTNLAGSAVTDQKITVNVSGVADADNADLDIDATDSDIVELTINSLTDSSLADVRADEVEKLTIVATGDLEIEDLSEAAALTDIVASGAGDITLGDLTDATTLDTVTHTGSGAFKAEILNNADMTIATGSGNDRIAVTDGDLDSDDSINLGAGTDTLAIGVDDAGTFTLTSAVMNKISGMEIIELATQAAGAGADSVTLDAAELHNRFAVGVIADTSDAADDTYAFDSVSSGAEVIIAESIGTIDVDLETASGTADVLTLTVGGAADLKIDGKADVDDFETVNIATTGTKAITIDDVDADAAKTITVSGTAKSVTFTDISDIVADTTVIDASSFKGDLTISQMGEAAKTIKGGSGVNDITLVAGALAQGNTYTAGSGTKDVLTVTATQDQNAGVLAVSGFETVKITTENGNTDTFTADFRNAQDIVTLNLASGTNTDNLVLNRLSSSTKLSIDDTFGNVTLSLQSGTAHTITAKTGATSVIDGTLTVDGAATKLNLDASDAALRLDAVAGGDLDQIVITGDNAVTVSAVPSGVSLIDASAMTAGTFTAVAGSGGTMIKAGAGASDMTGGAGKDNRSRFAQRGIGRALDRHYAAWRSRRCRDRWHGRRRGGRGRHADGRRHADRG